MMIDQLLIHLNSDDNALQQTALNQALLQKEAITPALLDIIVQYPQLNGARHNHRAFIAALYLLAQFKEKAAYPVIVDFFIQKNGIELINSDCEVVSEGLGRILASVCGNDLS